MGAGLDGESSQDAHPADEVVALIKESGGDAAVNGDDISTWAGGKNVVEQAIDTFGALDILVNNAGILRDKMSFNMDESDWDDVIRVHLKGHFAATHFAAVYWRNRAKSGEGVTGRIINTSSESGLYGNAGQANYAAAKAGIASLTWVEARSCPLRRHGQRHCAVGPHPDDRDHLRRRRHGRRRGRFRRLGPRELANVVAFLAAPASADITGQILVVFGGNIYAVTAFKAVGQVKRTPRGRPRACRRQGELFKGISSGVPDFSFL